MTDILKRGIILATTSTFAAQDKSSEIAVNESGFNLIVNPYKRKLTEPETVGLLAEYRPIGLLAGTEKLSRGILDQARSHLKVISRVGVGMDNVDLKAAEDYGIKVFSTPDAPTDAVAELAVGLMLSVLRNISLSDRIVRTGKWSPMMGGLLHGKTVGIIGFGRIGRKLAHILDKGFGSNVIGYDSFLQTSKPTLFNMVDTLDALLSSSDIVSLHAPRADTTSYLIGKKEIGLMKEGAIIINTSRGGLIDELELKAALDENRLAGAGLDVFEVEPYNGPLLGNENIVMTMHMGSYAKESRIRMEMEAVQNMISFLSAAEM